VSDFLKFVKDLDIEPIQLRETSSFTNKCIFFDWMNIQHRRSLEEICNILGIGIDFHYVNIQAIDNNVIGMWIGNRVASINHHKSIKNRMAVACYGDHFELIISQTEELKAKKVIMKKIRKECRTVEDYSPFIPTDENNGINILTCLKNDLEYCEKVNDYFSREIDIQEKKLKNIVDSNKELNERGNLLENEYVKINNNIKKCKKSIIEKKRETLPSGKYVSAEKKLKEILVEFDNVKERLNIEKNELQSKLKKQLNDINDMYDIKKRYHDQKINIEKNIKALK
jgi:hypothetical protein